MSEFEKVGPYYVAAIAAEIRIALSDSMCDANIQEAISNKETAAVWRIDTISPGAAGTHQPEEIISFLDLDLDPDDEWVWEDIDCEAGVLDDKLNKVLDGMLPEHFFLSLGHCEWMGTIALSYSFVGKRYNEMSRVRV